MQFTLSTSAATALLATLSLLSPTMAAPTELHSTTSAITKREMPHKINIGLNDKVTRDGKSMWSAWVNGADPCNHHRDLGVYNSFDSPCNVRFDFAEYDYQYSMHGCGGPLTIWKNGVENVGTCDWAPGHVMCIAGAGYTGQWQCTLN